MMNPWENPSANQELEEDILLLRFSSELRQGLQEEASHEDSFTIVEPEEFTDFSGTSPTRKRWILLATGSLLFLLCLGLLEMGYSSPTHHPRLQKQLTQEWKATRQSFNTLQSTRVQISSGLFRKHTETTLQRLQDIDRKFCLQTSSAPVHWSSWSAWSKPLLEPVRVLLSRGLQSPYNRIRRSMQPGRIQQWKKHSQQCLQKNQQLRARVLKFLRRKEKSFLRQATVHFQYFGWCRTRWLQRTYTPHQQQHYERFRKSRRCQRKCWGRRRRSRRCRRCWEAWQRETSIDKTTFRRSFFFVQREKLRQCRLWRNGKNAAGGVFHLGSYFWRVQRVLDLFAVLETYGLCDSRCQQTRKQWGFQLAVETRPSGGQMYLELWSKAHKAPTSTLQKLSQLVLKADGKPRWYPAIRVGLLRSRGIPQDLWYLFHFYDESSRKRALWTVAPLPGAKLKKTITLQSLGIKSDGRQPLRHLHFSSNGQWLTYLVEKPQPWKAQNQSNDSPCRVDSGKDVPLADIYVKRVTDDLFQDVRAVYRLQTRGVVSSLHLGGKESPYLLLNTTHTPVSLDKSQWKAATQPSTLWKLPLHPTLRADSVFGQPKVVLPPSQGSRDIPLVFSQQQLVTYRRQCKAGHSRVLLSQTPASSTPWRLELPAGYSLLQAVLEPQSRVSFLLQKKNGDANSTSYLLTGLNPAASSPTTSQPRQLKKRYSQVAQRKNLWVFAGGDFGSALQLWNGKEWSTLLEGLNSIRYLDPVIHPVTQRVYILQQRKVEFSQRPNHVVSFLISIQKTNK